MSKHAHPTTYGAAAYRKPKHSTGWTSVRQRDDRMGFPSSATPGKHAKPFGKHHPARPVTYDAKGRTTQLTPPALVLDAAA